MTKAATAIILFVTALLHSAVAQTTDKEWQARAVQKYPALGVQGSELNNRFLDPYTQRRKSDPSFFSDPRWPMILADELALTPRAVPSAKSARPPQKQQAVSVTPQPRVSSAEPSESDFPVGFVAIGVGVVGIIAWVSSANAAQRRKHRARLLAEAREYVELAQQAHALPTFPTKVMLKSGEVAFYSAPSALYETRAVRHYQSGYTGFRIAKGLYIGGSKGRSVSNQEWSKIDSGTLTITNKRLIFDGGGADRSVALTKILSADSSIDGVEVSVENRQKSMVFAAANPLILATIIRICCQAPDPLNLSDTPLQITFT